METVEHWGRGSIAPGVTTPPLGWRRAIYPFGAPVIVSTKRSRSECLDLLRRAIDPGDVSRGGKRAVYGWASDTRLSLYKRINGKNSFATRLSGRLSDTAGGTVILCRFSMHPFVMTFIVAPLIFWIVLAISGLLKFAFGAASFEAAVKAGDFIGVFFPLIIIVPLYAFVALGRIFTIGQRAFLISFVARVVSAGVDQPPPLASAPIGD